MLQGGFQDYRLRVYGLVEQPREFSAADIQRLPQKSQVTEHVCIQGWSGFAEWRGVQVSEILQMCSPLSNAHYVVFYSFQHDEQGRQFYETLPIDESSHPQTILAHEMNGAPLSTEHGAPLRLRVETRLGFKMVKWVESIEVVEDYRGIGEGQGGYREDVEYYGTGAEI
jgi:DMSO/TMAO reductase YedYZ molybdopterin-dependent catalytic subunit